MDDGNDRSQYPGASGRAPGGASRSGPLSSNSRPNGGEGQRSGGLLSRYAGQSSGPIGGAAGEQRPEGARSRPANGAPGSPGTPGSPGSARPAAGNGGGGLLSRARAQQQDGLRGALQGLTEQARRLGENVRRAASRTPQSGDWRATDFDPRTLEAWDRRDEAPFELPEEPEYTGDHWRAASGRSRAQASGQAGYNSRRSGPRDERQADEWDGGGWETGTWDTGWATGYEPAAERERGGYRGGREYEYGAGGVWSPPERREWYDEDDDALSRSLNTLARLGAVGEPIGRIARIRMLIRMRPAAAAMLALFLLGFMLTCCAPVIPLLRLGYDATDALKRVNTLQAMFSDTSSLLSATKLKDAQGEVDALTHDLNEINSAMNIAGAPFASVSHTVYNYRLLTRIGFDLTASADEGLQVAQTLLTPLQGGALAADTGTPGLTPDDIAQARGVLADASVRIQDALVAYQQFDPNVLKGPLKKLSKYLSLLPVAPAVLSEINRLLDSAPALLGIGQPANYLLLVMDRSELRPSGGFIGNYGILTLDGGKQSTKYPLTLDDSYKVDTDYFKAFVKDPAQPYCESEGPQPPNYYWWWPIRNDPNCTLAWGLRDSGLSADFPTNAQTAEQIVTDTPNKVPNTGKLQGVIAFTPILIEELLQVTGPLTVPEWNVTVTPGNLEHEIHEFQLGSKQRKNQPRKTFTHDLATELLNRIKAEHGNGLKSVLKIAETALKDKDLQLYFNDPQAELILRQLGLSSAISTGNGDGFFVVDTNDGGNKANSYVTEKQTDYVTLLPDGGALHHLQISVTYTKNGPVYEGTEQQEDYVDMQRTYLPGDATILGYSGYVPPNTFGLKYSCTAATAIFDCGATHRFSAPTTASDVPGRSMVFGSLWLSCGNAIDPTHTVETVQDFKHLLSGNSLVLAYDFPTCYTTPIVRTQNVYIEWYTPNAFAIDASGHGTYTELVEKQPGSGDFLLGVGDFLTVYVDTSQLHARHPNVSTDPIVTLDDWNALIGGKKPFIKNQQIDSNTTVTFGF